MNEITEMRSGSCCVCDESRATFLVRKDGYELVRCCGCGLVYLNHPPSEDALRKLYSYEAGYHAERIDSAAEKAPSTRSELKKLAIVERHCRAGQILDIGCSTGRFLNAASHRGWHCQGLEYSKDSAAVARDQFGLNVLTGVLTDRLFPDATFDVVTMWDVLEHIPDPRNALNCVHRLLKPGGYLFIETPRVDGLYPALSLPLARVLNFWGHAEPPGHLFQFSQKTCTRLLEERGFHVVSSSSQRIAISYSFGRPRQWLRSIKWMAYCLAFIPIALIGPWIGRGDSMLLVARRNQDE